MTNVIQKLLKNRSSAFLFSLSLTIFILTILSKHYFPEREIQPKRESHQVNLNTTKKPVSSDSIELQNQKILGVSTIEKKTILYYTAGYMALTAGVTQIVLGIILIRNGIKKNKNKNN